MFLDELVNRLNNTIVRYENILRYLKARRITAEIIREYKLGYNKIVRVSSDKEPEKSRFFEESKGGKKFENRLILPITDAFGRIVGIYGRSLERKDYKTFILDQFKQNGYFFGLYQALPHIYNTGKVFVVEGFFDLWAIRTIYPNVVATLTAGMNDNQYEYLSYYSDDIIMMLDADKAGRYGMYKTQKRYKKIRTIDIGYKDPAKCYETLDKKDFYEYLTRKVKESILL